ncbi:hypothetical protein KAR48_00210 [bacterium]|nr:hypothetical protein [bacterium]
MKMHDENGFWSAMYLVFLVTLGLMGVGAFVLVKSEGVNVANNAESIQAEYAANGAAYYAISRLSIGDLDENEILNIGGSNVSLDTSLVPGTTDIQLIINASLADKRIVHTITLSSGGGNGGPAVFATGNVNNIIARDSVNAIDPSLIVSNATQMPEIDYPALMANSNDAGSLIPPFEVSPNEYLLPNDWPSASGYYRWWSTNPNVTHIPGNLTLSPGQTIHGIFIIDGTITFSTNNVIDGIIIYRNSGVALDLSRRPQITGGVVVDGDVNGHGWWNSTLRHQPAYLRTFSQYVSDWQEWGEMNVNKWSMY